jgi:ribosomal-protein-alanine N-acetyltransferase
MMFFYTKLIIASKNVSLLLLTLVFSAMPLPKTKRLSFHEFTLNDAPFLLHLLNTPGWIKYIGDRGVRTIEEAENYLSARLIPSYAQYGFGFYLIRQKEDKIPVGMCGVIKRASLDDVDIGYAFLPDFSGKGYACEAAAATLLFAKTTLKIKRIVAITQMDNDRSIRLLEKIGMKCENKIVLQGETTELYLYAI